MTKEVLIALRGLQFSVEEGGGPIEVITAGEYYLKNGRHYLIYEEAIEGTQEITRNLIKVQPDYMELTRRGAVSVHMLFEKNKKNITYYYTPLGSLTVGIDTHKVDVEEQEEKIHVAVEYDLEINYEHVAECSIDLEVTSREMGEFRIS